MTQRFIRLPEPIHAALTAILARQEPDALAKAILYGIHIARFSIAWQDISDLYAARAVKKCRLAAATAWADVDEAADRFGISQQLVITASLHFALTDGHSPYFDQKLRLATTTSLVAAADSMPPATAPAPTADPAEAFIGQS
jgi:hypothetical protein